MPTIHRESGFRFIVYVDDHEPAHVHVWYAGAIARIDLGGANRRPEPDDPGSMKTVDVRRAVRIVEANKDAFLDAWRSIHG
jgi:hypothetical protein